MPPPIIEPKSFNLCGGIKCSNLDMDNVVKNIVRPADSETAVIFIFEVNSYCKLSYLNLFGISSTV